MVRLDPIGYTHTKKTRFERYDKKRGNTEEGRMWGGGKCEAEHSVIHSPLIVVHLGHLELPIKKTSLQICNINTYAYIVGYKDKHKLLKHSSCAQPTHKKNTSIGSCFHWFFAHDITNKSNGLASSEGRKFGGLRRSFRIHHRAAAHSVGMGAGEPLKKAERRKY